MQKEFDAVPIDGKPLPSMFVLPPGATFKVIEAHAARCDCGPVHDADCKADAVDAMNSSLVPLGYVVDQETLDALDEARRIAEAPSDE